MPGKLNSTPITQTDIEEYLKNYSDFSFELQVLKVLTDLNVKCEHGGTYKDPITGKTREFDIRGSLEWRTPRWFGYIRIYLSVECKNIRSNYPLVVHCVKRKANEAYNDLIYTFKAVASSKEARTIRNPPRNFLYLKGDYVAKSSDQVGRLSGSNDITATDGGVFEKISQALNSSHDLISQAYDLDTSEFDHLSFICPVLIVPDSTLWQVKYADDGTRLGSPEPADHVSYFTGNEWAVTSNYRSPLSYSMSHLEIMTMSNLKNFDERLWGYIGHCETFWRDLTNRSFREK